MSFVSMTRRTGGKRLAADQCEIHAPWNEPDRHHRTLHEKNRHPKVCGRHLWVAVMVGR